MSLFGKQNYHCVNCGRELYAQARWPWFPTCSKECFEEYELKNARSILGKDADRDPDSLEIK